MTGTQTEPEAMTDEERLNLAPERFPYGRWERAVMDSEDGWFWEPLLSLAQRLLLLYVAALARAEAADRARLIEERLKFDALAELDELAAQNRANANTFEQLSDGYLARAKAAESALAEATALLATADDPYDMPQWRRDRDALLARTPAPAAPWDGHLRAAIDAAVVELLARRGQKE